MFLLFGILKVDQLYSILLFLFHFPSLVFIVIISLYDLLGSALCIMMIHNNQYLIEKLLRKINISLYSRRRHFKSWLSSQVDIQKPYCRIDCILIFLPAITLYCMLRLWNTVLVEPWVNLCHCVSILCNWS